jgi:hypothetical protein
MWAYELKTLPRPRGKETQVIYTTWELPVTSRPHDTRIGPDGWIWFNHFNDNAHRPARIRRPARRRNGDGPTGARKDRSRPPARAR